jgi:hypothetical protein
MRAALAVLRSAGSAFIKPLRPVVLTAVLLAATSADAQTRTPAAPGRFAVGASVGHATFSTDDKAKKGGTVAISAEATLAPTWFVRAQYGAGPVDRFTLGLARSFAPIRPRAYLSVEAGFGAFDLPTWSSGFYTGAGLQVPIKESRLVFTGDARLFVLSSHLGAGFLAGVKMHL